MVGPKLQQLEQARLVKELQTRAQTASLNPAQQTGAGRQTASVRAKDGGTMGEALRRAMAANAGGRS